MSSKKPNFSNSKQSNSDKRYVRKQPKAAKTASETMRLNKYIANSGMCSRRDADLYIKSGNVMVNGAVVTEMGFQVKPTDEVIFDGARIKPEKKMYVLLNKPKGFSTHDKGMNNVLELVRSAGSDYLKPVGRMDATALGLLLFTNDDELIQKFTNAAQHTKKLYQVSLTNNLKPEDLEKIKKGVYINNHKVWVDDISYIDNQPKSEVGIELKTSNVKVVRLLFEELGYNVKKLDRMMFAGLTKWGLTRGQWRFLTEQEIINLKNIK